jgi:hypothetical protein
MSIIPFARPKPAPIESEQIGTGQAFCVSCRHEWVAVAPTGTLDLECPACQRHMGRFKFGFMPPPETEVRECGCGNQLFLLTREGHMCASCGVYQLYD